MLNVGFIRRCLCGEKKLFTSKLVDFVGASTPLLCVSSALELGNVFINLSGGHCLVQYVRN
jgi:hypothetical protein